MSNSLTFIGHSAFYIKKDNFGILIDPFISQNPKAIFKNDVNVTDIFVTHGHADHLGDAIPLSRKTKATISAIFELANYCAQHGAFVNPVNFGGNLLYPWGNAKFLPAFHSSSTPDGQYAGMPASILFEIDEIKIYHAGDTCLNSELKTIGELYKPDIALLPIGSQYTMDKYDAIVAAKWLGAKKIIPMHYNTFEAINVDIQKFKELAQKENIEAIILNPSESVEF